MIMLRGKRYACDDVDVNANRQTTRSRKKMKRLRGPGLAVEVNRPVGSIGMLLDHGNKTIGSTSKDRDQTVAVLLLAHTGIDKALDGLLDIKATLGVDNITLVPVTVLNRKALILSLEIGVGKTSLDIAAATEEDSAGQPDSEITGNRGSDDLDDTGDESIGPTALGRDDSATQLGGGAPVVGALPGDSTGNTPGSKRDEENGAGNQKIELGPLGRDRGRVRGLEGGQGLVVVGHGTSRGVGRQGLLGSQSSLLLSNDIRAAAGTGALGGLFSNILQIDNGVDRARAAERRILAVGNSLTSNVRGSRGSSGRFLVLGNNGATREGALEHGTGTLEGHEALLLLLSLRLAGDLDIVLDNVGVSSQESLGLVGAGNKDLDVQPAGEARVAGDLVEEGTIGVELGTGTECANEVQLHAEGLVRSGNLGSDSLDQGHEGGNGSTGNKDDHGLGLEVVVATVTKDTIDVSTDTNALVVVTAELGQVACPRELRVLKGTDVQGHRVRVLGPVGGNGEGMVDSADLGDLDRDVITGVVGLHGLGRSEGHADDIGVRVEGAGGLGEDGARLHDLGDEAIDEEEDDGRQEVVPEHGVGEVGDHADKEDGGEEAMGAQEKQVAASADLGDGSKTKETDSTLFTTKKKREKEKILVRHEKGGKAGTGLVRSKK